jgi:hypothetical protein
MALPRAVGEFLVKNHVTLETADDLLAVRMNFPAGPRLLETEKADEAAFVEIIAVALAILLVPLEAGELRLGNRARAKAEMDWKIIE